MLTYELPQSDLDMIRLIKACHFAKRIDAAKAAGRPANYITNLKRRAIAAGLVDAREWDMSFRTFPGTGMRGKDRRPRKKGTGRYPRSLQANRGDSSEVHEAALW